MVVLLQIYNFIALQNFLLSMKAKLYLRFSKKIIYFSHIQMPKNKHICIISNVPLGLNHLSISVCACFLVNIDTAPTWLAWCNFLNWLFFSFYHFYLSNYPLADHAWIIYCIFTSDTRKRVLIACVLS